MSIQNLSNVESWPDRILPQDRFDEKVQAAMNQMSVMVTELNNILIPIMNNLSVDKIPSIELSIAELNNSVSNLSKTLSGKASNTLMTGSSSSSEGSAGLVPPPLVEKIINI